MKTHQENQVLNQSQILVHEVKSQVLNPPSSQVWVHDEKKQVMNPQYIQSILKKNSTPVVVKAKCQFCYQIFTPENLKIHLEKIHNFKMPTVVRPTIQTLPQAKFRPIPQPISIPQPTSIPETHPIPRSIVSCRKCRNVFDNLPAFEYHLSIAHDGENKLQKSQTELQTKKPMMISAKNIMFKCKFCPQIFKTVAVLKLHIEQSHPFPSPVSCKLCRNVFNNVPTFENHVEQCRLANDKCQQYKVHEEKKPVLIPAILKKNLSPVVKHVDDKSTMAHHEEKRQVLNPILFNNNQVPAVKDTKMPVHEQKQTILIPSILKKTPSPTVDIDVSITPKPSKMFRCVKCQLMFTQLPEMNEHIKNGCSKTKNSIKTYDDDNNMVFQPMSCRVCKTVFNYLSAFKTHFKITHAHENEIKPQQKYLVRKTDNNQMKIIMPQIKLQQLSHEKYPVSCKVCKKEFNFLPLFQDHYRTKHKSEQQMLQNHKNYKVYEEKNRVVVQLPQMITRDKEKRSLPQLNDSILTKKEHVQQGKSFYKCQKCQGGFLTLKHFEEHLRNKICEKHDQEKTIFKCKFCLAGFADLDVMKFHIKGVHDDKNFFKCKICLELQRKGGVFPSRSSLKNHIKKVHEKVQPVSCKLCQKVFSYLSEFKYHLNVVHEGKTQTDVDEDEFYAEVEVSQVDQDDDIKVEFVKLGSTKDSKGKLLSKLVYPFFYLFAVFSPIWLNYFFLNP